jgi:hypothetical protein
MVGIMISILPDMVGGVASEVEEEGNRIQAQRFGTTSLVGRVFFMTHQML